MTKILTPAELQRKGMELLIRELGYADAARFMLQFNTGKGDYTRERRKLLKGVTLEQAIQACEKAAKEAKTAKPRRRRKSA